MRRSELREQVFKLLFRIEFNDISEMPEQVSLFFEYEEPMSDADRDEIHAKYERVLEHKDEIDALIKERTTGWNIERIGKVELTILRLAIYEMRFDDAVPMAVAINEAVELAKRFGPDDASGFVNGILAKCQD
ncbi:MAG: transcription antitermination factor NusB [Lachnospiraceae bacterium]|nr:transcription antitermination factor NusB [Lachnospiraceae bacterium]